MKIRVAAAWGEEDWVSKHFFRGALNPNEHLPHTAGSVVLSLFLIDVLLTRFAIRKSFFVPVTKTLVIFFEVCHFSYCHFELLFQILQFAFRLAEAYKTSTLKAVFILLCVTGLMLFRYSFDSYAF